MKKLLMAIAFLIIPAMILAQNQQKPDTGIKFSEGTFADVKAEAANAKKLIFIDIYASWCPPCKHLSTNVFPDEEVGKLMNAKFINAKFDAEKGEGKDIANAFKVEGYPTMIIADATGKELTRIVGASKTPEDFIKMINTKLETIKKQKK